jgi:hypothetical protein
MTVSGNADGFRLWSSSPFAEIRHLERLHSRIVSHFNRFVFLHRLKQIPNAVSASAEAFRIWHSTLVFTFRFLAKLHLSVDNFRFSSLESICLPWSAPSSVQTILQSCFSDCANLRRIGLEGGCKLSIQCVSDLQSKCEVHFAGGASCASSKPRPSLVAPRAGRGRLVRPVVNTRNYLRFLGLHDS